jgi:signal peptidase I
MLQEQEVLFYHGNSMRGMFRLGDRMFIEPVSLASLHPGDVVIYRKTDNSGPDCEKVVHRVVKVVPGGLIARGDNNRTTDVAVVLEKDIVGRVTHYERQGEVRRVCGGHWGLLRGWLLHRWHPTRRSGRRFIEKWIFPLGRPFYRWLRQSGRVHRIWHPPVVEVHLETEEGSLIIFVVGKCTVARWWPQSKRFWCRKPYDLIIPNPDKE